MSQPDSQKTVEARWAQQMRSMQARAYWQLFTYFAVMIVLFLAFSRLWRIYSLIPLVALILYALRLLIRRWEHNKDIVVPLITIVSGFALLVAYFIARGVISGVTFSAALIEVWEGLSADLIGAAGTILIAVLVVRQRREETGLGLPIAILALGVIALVVSAYGRLTVLETILRTTENLGVQLIAAALLLIYLWE